MLVLCGCAIKGRLGLKTASLKVFSHKNTSFPAVHSSGKALNDNDSCCHKKNDVFYIVRELPSLLLNKSSLWMPTSLVACKRKKHLGQGSQGLIKIQPSRHTRRLGLMTCNFRKSMIVFACFLSIQWMKNMEPI